MRSRLATDVPPNFMTRKDIQPAHGRILARLRCRHAVRGGLRRRTHSQYAGASQHQGPGAQIGIPLVALTSGTMHTAGPDTTATLDPAEIDRFARNAAE